MNELYDEYVENFGDTPLVMHDCTILEETPNMIKIKWEDISWWFNKDDLYYMGGDRDYLIDAKLYWDMIWAVDGGELIQEWPE